MAVAEGYQLAAGVGAALPHASEATYAVMMAVARHVMQADVVLLGHHLTTVGAGACQHEEPDDIGAWKIKFIRTR